jgi:hypothetical protein
MPYVVELRRREFADEEKDLNTAALLALEECSHGRCGE